MSSTETTRAEGRTTDDLETVTGAIDPVAWIELDELSPAHDPPRTVAVVSSTRFGDDLDFFTALPGFALHMVMPADDPTVAVVTGPEIAIRLVSAGHDAPAHLLIEEEAAPSGDRRATPDGAPRSRTSPGGSVVEWVQPQRRVAVPPSRPTRHVSRHASLDDGNGGVIGRAGMTYRDLLPDRWGGRFIASHIHLPDGGPVADYVHYHRIRYQLIVVVAGWVDVVYEGQGDPFRMLPGDCVLQPPQIRHRVLRSSAGLEVIEIGCPAEHETIADPRVVLPSADLPDDHLWSGQRFVRHQRVGAEYGPWRLAGWTARDSGIGAATNGLAGVRFARPDDAATGDDVSTGHRWARHECEFELLAVMSGSVTVEEPDTGPTRLDTGDTIAIPGGHAHRLVDPDPDTELLDVTLPEHPRPATEPR